MRSKLLSAAGYDQLLNAAFEGNDEDWETMEDSGYKYKNITAEFRQLLATKDWNFAHSM
jgi:hypothetical protein